ncbi:flippase [Methanosarcina sp. KYL-1]|uniref:flippase n=1 Tax=Methanosarcina sp. KYL-1 TaxID=2602068 RepID=UPI002100C1FF|nr:flippase [Methanosarcina sp. KYL-1]MCQ1536897.1 flippase [Methanosarcina sp. KYL-1]
MKQSSEKLGLKKIGINSFQTITRQSLSIVFGLGLYILLARILGPEGSGLYAMGLLLPSTLATFLNLGVTSSNVYFIASGKVTPVQAAKTSFLLWAVLSLIGCLAASAVIITQGEVWFPGVPKFLLWLGTLAFPVILLLAFLEGFFQGVQDFKSYNMFLLLVPGLTLVFALILVGILRTGVMGALLSFIGGNVVGLLIGLGMLRSHIRRNKQEVIGSGSKNYLRECLNYGWKSHLSNMLAFVNYKADIFLVNFFLSPAATGIYSISVLIAEKLWILSYSVGAVILPHLSELHQEEQKRKQLTPLIARWVLFASSLGAAIIALVAFPFINLLFGKEFAPAFGALLWLLPGVAIYSMARVLSNDIAARGKPELNCYNELVVVTVNVLANIVLIPRFGIKGAAIATSIAYILGAITKLWIYSYVSKNEWWKPIIFDSYDRSFIKESIKLVIKAFAR